MTIFSIEIYLATSNTKTPAPMKNIINSPNKLAPRSIAIASLSTGTLTGLPRF